MKSGIFIIDKPSGFTSHDVVAKMRRLLSERRIGHSGTLDPMATGVLPVFAGRPATKAVEFAINSDKEYIARLKLGIKTDTMDITGTVLKTAQADIPLKRLERVLSKFTGEISQIPPMYSAIKIEGKKLYELAREGIEVPRQSRAVTIYELELISEGYTPEEFYIRVLCSKGTYIRTLCNDIGDMLGCGGVMSELRRTKCCGFAINEAITLDDVKNISEEGGDPFSLAYGTDYIFRDYPCLTVCDESIRLLKNGVPFTVSGASAGDTYRVYSESGEFLMLGSAVENRAGEIFMTMIKSFY